MVRTNPRGEGSEFAADNTLSASESLALIDEQQAEMRRVLHREPTALYLMWSVVWLAVFALAFLAAREDQLVPGWLAGVLGGALIVGGVIVSAVVGIRMGYGIRGESSVAGAMYGWSWTLGFLALTGVNLTLMAGGMPDDLISPLWSGSSMVLAGVLCLAAGAMFRDIPQYVLGGWFLLVAPASVLAGSPENLLVVGIGGALGFAGRAVLPRLLRNLVSGGQS
ncbi:MAG: hypothetical protein GEU98_10005 [Pseudonocardiaceae bacterium]|nr:hypothetical protein [Pseudonocardiaceae bacterium]